MITACHTLIYTDDADATRAFLRDVLQLPYVDSGGPEPGWLIFRTGPSEVAAHPTSSADGSWSAPRHHAISFICDDIEATMSELRERGAEFSSGPDDHGYGLVTMMKVPGADDIQVYEPRHTVAHSL